MKLDTMDATFYGGVAVLVGVLAVFFASGAFRGDSAPGTSWSAFVTTRVPCTSLGSIGLSNNTRITL